MTTTPIAEILGITPSDGLLTLRIRGESFVYWAPRGDRREALENMSRREFFFHTSGAEPLHEARERLACWLEANTKPPPPPISIAEAIEAVNAARVEKAAEEAEERATAAPEGGAA